MKRATKIRLYPTPEQKQLLAVQFGCVRFVWNRALALRKAAWDERRESLSFHTIKSLLPVWKKSEFPWLKDADSQALQEAVRHLDRAYGNFFEKRARPPRFKQKHAPRQSFAYPQRVRLAVVDGSHNGLIYLPKIGWVKAVVHRAITGTIKTVTVSRESTDKYYAAILTDDGAPEARPLQHFEQVTGIDLGLKDAIARDDGGKTTNPQFLQRAIGNLKRKQQALSRKIEQAKVRCDHDHKPIAQLRDYFGPNIAKARRQVARAHERVRFAREDWQHKLSRQLADENQAVAAETLNVKGMLGNRRLARAISDVGWSGLLTKLEYKLRQQGGRLVKIDRFYPSSKTCSCCGIQYEGLRLSERSWTCAGCGATHDRDINAAINIRRQGILKLKAEGLSVSAHGGYVSPALAEPAMAVEVGSPRL